MTEKKKYKAIYFDLDGVLVNATEIHYNALNEALKQNNYPIISREDHEKKYNGLPTNMKLQYLGIPEEIKPQIWNDKQLNTLAQIISLVKPDEEKISMMMFLKANGLKIGVVTNCIEDTASLMLETSGLAKYIDFAVYGDMVKNNKPASEGYTTAMIKLQSMPCETLIVEDSEYGYHSAISTGSDVIKVTGYNDVNTNLFLNKGII